MLDDGRETIGTTPLDAIPDVILRMPGDSLAPLLLSIALVSVFVGMMLHSWWIFGIAMAASLLATIVALARSEARANDRCPRMSETEALYRGEALPVGSKGLLSSGGGEWPP